MVLSPIQQGQPWEQDLFSPSSPHPQEWTGLDFSKSCRSGSPAGFPPGFQWPISQLTSVYFIARQWTGLGPLQASYWFLLAPLSRPSFQFWQSPSCSTHKAAVKWHQVGLGWNFSPSTLGFLYLSPLDCKLWRITFISGIERELVIQSVSEVPGLCMCLIQGSYWLVYLTSTWGTSPECCRCCESKGNKPGWGQIPILKSLRSSRWDRQVPVRAEELGVHGCC